MFALEEHSFLSGSGPTINYIAAGPSSGTLIVFCHGWPAIARTWKCQLEHFAKLGYRAIAPDMPGYGKSSSTRIIEDYALERVNQTMASLLVHVERDAAIWIGHDWGAVAVWSFAAHYPEKTIAVVGLARPYHTLEFGLEEVLKTVNREVFPEEQYPYGQYDYQFYFERAFEETVSWFDQDPNGVLRAIYAKGNAEEVGKPGMTASVTTAGGWFGGAAAPPSHLRRIPLEATCVDEDLFNDVLEAMTTTGFWGPCAWYGNHQRNRSYSIEKSKNDGVLQMPALFIGAAWDPISDITISTIASAQRQYCTNLTEVVLDAGHWVALEKPVETNDVIAAWLSKTVLMPRSSG